MLATPYEGRADAPWPPFSLGWAECAADDAEACERGRLLLGALPPYHYADDALPGGLYRFFAFDTPIGQAVGALKFVGEARAMELSRMGQAASGVHVITLRFPNQGTFTVTDAAAGDSFEVALPTGAAWQDALAANDANATVGSAPSQGTNPAGFTFTGGVSTSLTAHWSDASGGAQTTVITVTTLTQEPAPGAISDQPAGIPPISYPSKVAAATAMNQALAAHGYKRADQGIYKGYQSLAGLVVDGFPGTNTINSLRATLQAAGMQLANVRVYPWLSSGTYDGTNAPTWAEWTGAAAAPPAAPKSSNAGMVAGVGIAAALAVGVAAVIAKSSGALGAVYG